MRDTLVRSHRDIVPLEPDGSGLIQAARFVLRRPLEITGSVVMAGVVGAVLVNALALQTGSHPAPLFARQAAIPLPVTRVEPDARGVLVQDIQLGLKDHASYDGPTDGVLGPKTDAAIRGFQVGAGLPVDGEPSDALLARIQTSRSQPAPPRPATPAVGKPGDPIAALIRGGALTPPDRRLLRVEQALAALGYGPLKVDGVAGPDTRAAIERFQRDQGLAADGQVSAGLTKALAAMTDQPAE